MLDIKGNQLLFKTPRKLKILYAASEVAPFAKSGGLGDVAGALPIALAEAGHDIRIVTPLYRQCREKISNLVKLPVTRKIRLAQDVLDLHIEVGHLPNSNVTVYFVSCDDFYDRPELYRERGRDYRDNAARFIFFSKAVLELMYMIDFWPDIIHSNDWQTGLIPIFQKTLHSHKRRMNDIASVFTVHNMAYQGVFWHLDMPLTGLPWSYFTPDKLEYYGMINLMKGGLIWSDVITTVSERYAREIQSPEFGFGLHGVLLERRENIYGVINGVDTATWNPASDRLISHNFTADNLGPRKLNRQVLLQQTGLQSSEKPIIGIVSRLCDQKGIDLVIEAIPQIMGMGAQLCVLGRGDPEVEDVLLGLAENYQGDMHVFIDFDEQLAHQIEAGVDMYLMPSRYEPCGLNQMYSMLYGAVPIVRETGGLADTVPDYFEHRHMGRGFTFRDYTVEALLKALKRAIRVYNKKPDEWLEIMRRGMKTDFSWERSASIMVDIYEKAMVKKAKGGLS